MILSIFFSCNNPKLHLNPSLWCCTEGCALKLESQLVMRRDECSERIYRGHCAFYLVMLPGLLCTVLFFFPSSSSSSSFFSHQRMGAEKKTPEIKQTKLIRRQPKDTSRCAEVSFPPTVPLSSTLAPLPEANTPPLKLHPPPPPPADFHCQRERRETRAGGSREGGTIKDGRRERAGDRR